MRQSNGMKQKRRASALNSSTSWIALFASSDFYPYAGMQVEPEIRRFLFTRFPYSLVYGIDKETIVVIAVANQHREPSYWADRIDNVKRAR